MNQEILDSWKKELKSSLLGVDSQIDKIISTLAGWSKNIKSPIILNLVGLPGTGKTTIASKLKELFEKDFKTEALSISCNKGIKISDNLMSQLGFTEWKSNKSIKDIQSMRLIIIEELHKAKDLDEDSKEIQAKEKSSSYEDLWELMDKGLLNWKFSGAIECDLDKMAAFNNLIKSNGDYYNIPVERGRVDSKDLPKELDDILELIDYAGHANNRAWRRTKHKRRPTNSDTDEPEETEDETIDIINEHRWIINSILSKLCDQSERDNYFKRISESTTLIELIRAIDEIIGIASENNIIDFHNSLIITTSNLDEAFPGVNLIDADIDADILHEITSDVTMPSIKEALKTRFRLERISRLGNNFIIFPSFNRATFNQVIIKNLNSDFEKFEKDTGIKIHYSYNIIELIYNEGVFPALGVRSVESTIHEFERYLSKIEAEAKKIDKSITEVVIDCQRNSFNNDTTDIWFEFKRGDNLIKKITETHENILGSLRNPKNNESRYNIAVHELGHALVSWYLTNMPPSAIYTTTTEPNCAGFCMTNIKRLIDDKRRHHNSIQEVESGIKEVLGGWVAENLIFDKQMRSSSGCSSDINKAWRILSDIYYEGGVVSPIPYNIGTNHKGIPVGYRDNKIDLMLKDKMSDLIEDTKEILSKFENVIPDIAIELAEIGFVNEDGFKEVLSKYQDENKYIKDLLYSTPKINSAENTKDFLRKKKSKKSTNRIKSFLDKILNILTK